MAFDGTMVAALCAEIKNTVLNDRIVSINVSEKKIIGYAYEDNENVLCYEFNNNVISKIPIDFFMY